MRGLPFLLTMLAGCGTLVGLPDRVANPELDGTDGGADVVNADASSDSPESGTGGCAVGDCLTIPTGFTPVAFDNSKRSGCPSGWASPTDVVVDGGVCACNCNPTKGPSCAQGNVQVHFFSDATCTQDAQDETLNSTDVCGVRNTTTKAYAKFDPIAGVAATCGVPVALAVPVSSGRFCAAGPNPTCLRGVCVPRANGDFNRCVMQAGNVTCPPQFRRKTLVGTSVASDTRQCGACTCAAQVPGCPSPKLELYTDGACQATGTKLTINPTCAMTPNNTNYQSFLLSVKPQGGLCQVTTQPPATGALTLAGVTTICCPED